jgi:hypothetical protein
VATQKQHRHDCCNRCRSVSGIPVFLCTFHVCQAWLLKVRIKLKIKSRFEQAFGMLHSIAYLRFSGTPDEMLRGVDDAIEDFKATFSDEKPLLAHFEGHWEKKKGVSCAANGKGA